jgi:hypothetical protein
MAEDNGVPPLPRRVPRATDSPRPPTRIEQQVLPESVRQQLLVVLAQEQERVAREPAAPPREGEEAAAQVQPAAPDGPGPPQERPPFREEKAPPERAAALGKAGSPHKAGDPEAAASAEPFVPLPRRPSRGHDRPAQPPVTSWDAVPAPPLGVQAEAPTEPLPRIPALGHESPSAPVNPGDTEAAPPPERPVPVPDTPTAAVPDTRAAAVSAPNGRVAGQQAGRRQRRPGRRYRTVGVFLSVAALITAGSLALTLYGHSASAVAPRGHRQRPASGEDPATRDQAAAWVAGQVARTTIVSAEPAMCRVLESYGFPVRSLYGLGPEATNPLRSKVIVATPAVRAQFGTLLSSVYAPAVLASFGSGRQRIDIREIAPRGAAAYRSMLAADLAARKSTGAALLRSNRINVSPTARKQLAAGQVDSRLEITVAAMAAKRPVYIVAFNGFAPGAEANMPLRFGDLVQASSGYRAGSRSVTPAFVRSMAAFLHGPAPFRPLRVETVRLAGGHTVLRIEFAAPSPFGLFGSR